MRLTLILLLLISKFLYAEDANSQASSQSSTISTSELVTARIGSTQAPLPPQTGAENTQPDRQDSIAAKKLADNTKIQQAGCGNNLPAPSDSNSSFQSGSQANQEECLKLAQIKHASNTSSSNTNTLRSASAQANHRRIANNRSQNNNNGTTIASTQ